MTLYTKVIDHWFIGRRAETVNDIKVVLKARAIDGFQADQQNTLVFMRNGERILLNVKFEDFQEWFENLSYEVEQK